jgi:MurNAc alpha-1-phosphate uridylyltransferase
MILAAGRGERMRPLTDTTPKPLLQVGGNPLIAWHIRRMAQAGIAQIIINHAHLGEQIEQALGTGAAFDVSIEYSPEANALETAGGIRHALQLLGDDPFLVVNGDVWTDYDFAALHQLNWTDGRLAHLVLVDNPPQHPTGDFGLNRGKVLNTDATQYTFSGIGCYQPVLFADLVDNQPAKLAPLLREAIQQEKVSGEHYAGEWHDIGTPQRLTELDEALNGRK